MSTNTRLISTGLPTVNRSFWEGGGCRSMRPPLRLCGRDGAAGPVVIIGHVWHSPPVDESYGRQVAVLIDKSSDSPTMLQIWNLDGTPGPICAVLASPLTTSGRLGIRKADRIAANCGDGRLRIWKSDG